jgi:Spy/CpxP family protein refolding chaperone
MLTKSKLAIAAALVLGAASAAQAANDNQSDPNRGFAYGPMGQRMGGSAVNPVHHLSTRNARGTYAYVPPSRVHIRSRSWDRSWE